MRACPPANLGIAVHAAVQGVLAGKVTESRLTAEDHAAERRDLLDNSIDRLVSRARDEGLAAGVHPGIDEVPDGRGLA